MLRIELVKSVYGNNPRNRATIVALGLRKMHSVVEHEDTPTIRGMVHHVKHLLKVTEVEGEPKRKQSPRQRPMKRNLVEETPVVVKKAKKTVKKSEE
jgi:large subunit ribosomal protein L30